MSKNRLALALSVLLFSLTSTANASATIADYKKAAVMNQCMEKRACRFHVVGAATAEPIGVFSITPATRAKFKAADKAMFSQYAKLWLEHAVRNPERALTDKEQGAGMNPQAPILPRMAQNLRNNLTKVEFLVSTSKMKDGRPGWSEGETIKELTVSFTPAP